jgi:DNA replicative helicase MCM subunit Mcm2 (Cdc46/Mcm family)
MTTFVDNITSLEATDGTRPIEIVSNFMSIFNSKSVIVLLNHKYQNKIIESPVILEDWNLTNERFDNILKNKGVAEEDRIILVRMLNHNAKRITDHFSEQTLAHTDAGQKAKKERVERVKNAPPVEVSVSHALMMHEGNVRVRGMFVGGSAKVEKMYVRLGFRCGYCDKINVLADYRDTRPRFASEIPSIFGPRYLNRQKCEQGCESFAHDSHDEVVSALGVELHDTETSNDPERLYVVLFDDCIKNVSYLEQVIITGSLQRVRVKDKLLPHVFVGLDTPTPNGVNPIEYVNKKESVELTIDDEKKIQEFAIQNKGRELDALADLVAPSIIGYEDVKKGLLLCAANSGKDSVKRKRRINVLLIGETGLAKTPLAREAIRLIGLNSKFASAVDSTVSSLISVVDKDTGFFRFGPVLMANGAICSIDEIGRMPLEDQGRLLSALQEGTISFGRYGLTRPLEASASFVLTANPNSISGKFRDGVKIDSNEFPFLGPFKDRIDLTFVFRTKRCVDDVRDYASKKSEIMDNYNAITKEEEENYEFLRRYILYGKRFDPRFSQESEHMIKAFFTNIVSPEGSQASYRVLDTLRNLCYAVARLKLKDAIDAEDANDVMKFYNEQLKHYAQVSNIPSDPRDFAYEEVIKKLTGQKFKSEFMELLQAVCKDNVYVDQYTMKLNEEGKRDWHVKTNIKVRQIRNKFTKGPKNDKILILNISPLVLAWRETYEGSDKDAIINADNIDTDYYDESDKNDTSDIDKKWSEDNKLEGIPDNSNSTRPEITDNDIMSNITHITPITPSSKQDFTKGSPSGSSGSGGEKDGLKDDTRTKHASIITNKHVISQVTSLAPVQGVTAIVPLERSARRLLTTIITTAQKTSLQDSEGQYGEEPIEDYEAYIARQKKLFEAIGKDTPTPNPSSSSSISRLDPNGDPILPPYVHRMYAGSDMFVCEYCSIKQDRWGMATHFHPEGFKRKK